MGDGAAASRIRGLRATADELEHALPFGVADQLLDGVHTRPSNLDGSGEEATLRAIHLAYRRIEELAAAGPMLIAVDDAHWADELSLRLLIYLARRLESLPLLIIVSHRTTEALDPSRSRLVNRLAELAADVIRLRALTPSGVKLMVRARLGADGDQLAAACSDQTAGNPLLASWLLDRLAAGAGSRAGALPEAGEVASIAAAGAEELAARRLRLEPEPERVVRAVAILGADASLETVSRTAELSSGDAALLLGRLQRSEILTEAEPIRFAHPLIKTAVMGAMPDGERRALAGRAAGALYAAGAGPERIAARLIDAGAADEPWAPEILDRAAAIASAAGAAGDAASCLRLAVTGSQAESERDTRLLELAQAEATTGEEGYERRFEEALARIDDPVARASALLRMADTRTTTRYEVAEAIALVLRAIETLGDADAELGSRLVATLASISPMAPAIPSPAAEVVSERLNAIRAAPPAQPSDGERLLIAQAMMLATLTSSADREACLELASPLMQDGGLPLEPAVFSAFTIALIACDEFAAAERLLGRATADAGERGAITQYLWLVGGLALAKLRSGDPAAGLQDVRDANALAAEVGVEVPFHTCIGAFAAIESEGANPAAAFLESTPVERYRGMLIEGDLLLANARVAAAKGRAESALELALGAGRAFQARGFVNPNLHEWRSVAALAALAAGEREQAAELAASELELARRFGSRRGLGIALRTSGLVAGGEAGLAQLAESVDVLDGSPALLARAASELELGSALRRAHRPHDAQRALESAVDRAHVCRARPIVERGLEELAALGRRRQRPALTGVDALTPAELRTARMAARGMPNKAIASELFLALRTIESHLTSTYKKLGIDSREELAPALEPREGARA